MVTEPCLARNLMYLPYHALSSPICIHIRDILSIEFLADPRCSFGMWILLLSGLICRYGVWSDVSSGVLKKRKGSFSKLLIYQKGSYSWLSKKTVLSDLGLSDEQFLDVCILAGFDYCPTFPPLNNNMIGFTFKGLNL